MRRHTVAFIVLLICRVACAANTFEGTDHIGIYVAHVDASMKQMKTRFFAEAISQGRSTWREVKAGDGSAGNTATVYMDHAGVPIVAVFTMETESGDWILDASYYFRPDGSLAKMHEHLNTFYGHATVIRDSFFGCHGEVYGSTTSHVDLKTKQPKKPDPEFVDERAPLFKRIQDLPFFTALVNNQRERSRRSGLPAAVRLSYPANPGFE